MLWEGTEQAYSFFAFLSISKLSLSLLFSLYLTLDIGINPPLPFFLFLFGALVYCLRPFCFSVVLFFLLESLIAFLLLSSLSFLYGVQLYSVWNRMPLLYCVFPLSITFENSSLVCVSLSLSLSLSLSPLSLSLSLSLSLTLPLSLFVIGYLAVSLYVRVSRYLSFTASLLFCHRYLLMQQSS